MQNHQDKDEPIQLKFITIGDYNVGKSSLVRRFCDDKFSQMATAPMSCNLMIKKLIINSVPVHINFWDTAGVERYRPLNRVYFRGADAVFFVYDIYTLKSLKSTDEKWIQYKRDFQEITPSRSQEILVGNKADLSENREIPIQMVEDVSLRHNIEWKEVCAKTGEGVKELFEEIVLRVLKRKEKIKEDVELMLKQNKPEGHGKCF